jgi:hypothetical protein
MLNRLCIALCVALGLLLAGCPEPEERLEGSDVRGESVLDKTQYPIPFPERPYTDIHASAKQAWLLTENAYFVVSDKYRTSKGEQRQAIVKEIDERIFAANEKIEKLFKEAIEAEPENPLNHATYALWLKPRKRMTEKGFVPAETDALEQIDQAIKLWPDESSFYLTKIFILTAPHQAHDWLRAGAMEELAIANKMDQISEAFTQAEKYDPQNSFINYWHALILYKFSDPSKFAETSEQILREIHAGNLKPEGYFVFGAPVRPRALDAQVVTLMLEQTEPVFIDQWTQFGSFPANTIQTMIADLIKDRKWPEDKDAIVDIMYFPYALGRVRPYDRSYFSMQQLILTKLQSEAKGTPDAGKFADAARFLDEQLRSVANRLYTIGWIKDPAKVNPQGVREVENGPSRQNGLGEQLQGPQASYLKRFSELFKVDFPLPEDPEQW